MWRPLSALVLLLCAAPVFAGDRPELPKLVPQEQPAQSADLWAGDRKWIAVAAGAGGVVTAVALIVTVVMLTQPQRYPAPDCFDRCR